MIPGQGGSSVPGALGALAHGTGGAGGLRHWGEAVLRCALIHVETDAGAANVLLEAIGRVRLRRGATCAY